MTGPRRFVIFVAALAVLLAIVMATDGHPLAVIAAVLVPARFFAVLARAKPLTTRSFYMALWATNREFCLQWHSLRQLTRTLFGGSPRLQVKSRADILWLIRIQYIVP